MLDMMMSNELGFMELLGMDDFCTDPPSLLYDLDDYEDHNVVQDPLLVGSVAAASEDAFLTNKQVERDDPLVVVGGGSVAAASEEDGLLMMNKQQPLPTTPNSSSSISSESAAVVVVHEDQQHNNNSSKPHELKPIKTSQQKKKKKVEREARFAFVTKSEVDHLEDGFRWRKYGQKAVKDSPFPRSYYKCTSAKCNVKKRVERSFDDPTIVVTTYEGKHTHPCPVMLRPNVAAGLRLGSTDVGPTPATALPPHHHHQQPPQMFKNDVDRLFSLPFVNSSCGYQSSTNPASFDDHKSSFGTPKSALLKDNGLLQDMVLSFIGKED